MKAFLKKNIIPAGLFLLTMSANIFFFIKRNDFGIFTDYRSYDELYAYKNNQPEQRKKWNNTYYFSTAEEKKEAQQFAYKKAGVNGKEPSLSKMIKIGKWIVADFSGCITGRPVDSIAALPMMKQYEAITQGKTPIWCGTYGNIFLFFCKASDIETRMIEFFNPGNHHIVNECFIPELNKWVAADLTYNYLLLKDESGNVINTLDLIGLVHNNKPLTTLQAERDSLLSKTIPGTSLLWKQYLQLNPDIYFYKETNLSKIYSRQEKIKRYFLQASFCEVYAERRKSNFWFYARLFFLWISLPLFVYLFYRMVRR